MQDYLTPSSCRQRRCLLSSVVLFSQISMEKLFLSINKILVNFLFSERSVSKILHSKRWGLLCRQNISMLSTQASKMRFSAFIDELIRCKEKSENPKILNGRAQSLRVIIKMRIPVLLAFSSCWVCSSLVIRMLVWGGSASDFFFNEIIRKTRYFRKDNIFPWDSKEPVYKNSKSKLSKSI